MNSQTVLLGKSSCHSAKSFLYGIIANYIKKKHPAEVHLV